MIGDILLEEEAYALTNGGECVVDELHMSRADAVFRLASYHECTEAQGVEEGYEIKKVKVVISEIAE
jgi:hypothetical protein